MTLLFSEAGLQRLQRIVQPGMLCVFDFDGTLSPIVAQPQEASLPLELRRGLIALNQLTPVAVLTGRSVDDVRARLGFSPDYVIGNHGVEGVPGWESRAAQCEQICRGWREFLDRALQDEERFTGRMQLEDKRYSLSVHYRQARDPQQAQLALQALFAQLQPATRVISGKYVFNLLPPDAPDKGRALAHLMRTCAAPTAIYVGDDVTDEDVFRLRRPDLLSVRVEKMADSAAEYYLAKRVDMEQLLNTLIERLESLQRHKQTPGAQG